MSRLLIQRGSSAVYRRRCAIDFLAPVSQVAVVEPGWRHACFVVGGRVLWDGHGMHRSALFAVFSLALGVVWLVYTVIDSAFCIIIMSALFSKSLMPLSQNTIYPMGDPLATRRSSLPYPNQTSHTQSRSIINNIPQHRPPPQNHPPIHPRHLRRYLLSSLLPHRTHHLPRHLRPPFLKNMSFQRPFR